MRISFSRGGIDDTEKEKTPLTQEKVASLVDGGPLGYLCFGMDETRKYETDGDILVTPSFVRYGKSDYPIEKVVGLERTLPAPSVVLALKKDSGVERQLGWGTSGPQLTRLVAELKVKTTQRS